MLYYDEDGKLINATGDLDFITRYIESIEDDDTVHPKIYFDEFPEITHSRYISGDVDFFIKRIQDLSLVTKEHIGLLADEMNRTTNVVGLISDLINIKDEYFKFLYLKNKDKFDRIYCDFTNKYFIFDDINLNSTTITKIINNRKFSRFRTKLIDLSFYIIFNKYEPQEKGYFLKKSKQVLDELVPCLFVLYLDEGEMVKNAITKIKKDILKYDTYLSLKAYLVFILSTTNKSIM
jgi:hypothetical protein